MDSEVTDLAGIKAVIISTLQVKPSEGAFEDGDKTKLNENTQKLNGIQVGAQVNVKPDWDASDGNAAEILNKPTIPYDIIIPLSDETTALEAATDVVTFVAPRDFTLVGMAISLGGYGSGQVTVRAIINGTIKTVSITSSTHSSFNKSSTFSLPVSEGNVIKCSITLPGTGASGLKLYLMGNI